MIEPLMVRYAPGSTVYFRVFDPITSKFFDFDDNTWQTTAVNPKLAATENTAAGDADESVYTAELDLALLNATASVMTVLVTALDDLATDAIISAISLQVASGAIPAPAASGDATLEAVNEMLEIIGEAPVDALDTGGVSAAGRAEAILDRTERRVQSMGWYENTESVTYTPDGSKHVEPGTDILSVDAINASTDFRVSLRNGRVYDLENRTDEFDGDMELEVIRRLAFSDMSDELRAYAVAAACQEFYRAMIGDGPMKGELELRMQRAQSRMHNADIRSGDVGMLQTEHAATILGHSWATRPERQ
ncbi:MAG: hypothetical protein WC683_06780 [bacterium]